MIKGLQRGGTVLEGSIDTTHRCAHAQPLRPWRGRLPGRVLRKSPHAHRTTHRSSRRPGDAHSHAMSAGACAIAVVCCAGEHWGLRKRLCKVACVFLQEQPCRRPCSEGPTHCAPTRSGCSHEGSFQTYLNTRTDSLGVLHLVLYSQALHWRRCEHHAAPGASPPLRAAPEEPSSRRCDPLRGASLLCVGARGVGLEHTTIHRP